MRRYASVSSEGLNVAARGMSALATPSQLGPQMAMPWRSAIRCSSSWRTRAASPFSSPKPDEMTTAALIPRAPHSSSTSATDAAGITTTARSTGSGIAATEGYAVSPCTSARLGVTGKIFPG